MRKLIILATISILLLFAAVPAFAASPGDPPGLERAIAVQERHNRHLLTTPGITGTAVGLVDGKPVIQVFTERASVPGIPAVLEEIPVVAQVTGKLTAIGPSTGKGSKDSTLSTTDYWPRPVPIGVSTGNANEVSAGTIGARVTGQGKVYALSNNHVYARENAAALGEEVLQPGLYDTKGIYNSKNHLGNLSDFVWIKFDGTANQVDAAIALTDTTLLGNATPSNGYGIPKSVTVSPSVGMAVQKYGRTTQLTKGTITGINATISVGYGASGTAYFEKQIIVQSIRPFIKAGDSGSLLVNPKNNPVGLLFASDSSGRFAIANDIGLVLEAFKVTVDDSRP